MYRPSGINAILKLFAGLMIFVASFITATPDNVNIDNVILRFHRLPRNQPSLNIQSQTRRRMRLSMNRISLSLKSLTVTHGTKWLLTNTSSNMSMNFSQVRSFMILFFPAKPSHIIFSFLCCSRTTQHPPELTGSRSNIKHKKFTQQKALPQLPRPRVNSR